jgi:WD40 repeat protein
MSGEKKARFQLDRGGRGVVAAAISHCGNYVALVDKSNDHNVYVFDANTGAQKMKEKGDGNSIYDICFTQQDGQTHFGTAGAKHIKFWNVDGSIVGKKGLHGSHSMTSHACIAWDDAGNAYTGATNSLIYVWDGAGSRQATKTIEGHGKGFICSIIWRAGKLYSGGKDGNVLVTDTASGSVTATIEFGCLIRAIDVNTPNMVVGTRDGNIWCCNDDGSNKRKVMESHSDGEVWGLAVGTGNVLITTADDN